MNHELTLLNVERIGTVTIVCPVELKAGFWVFCKAGNHNELMENIKQYFFEHK